MAEHTQNTGFFQSVNNDEQSGKEENGCPVDEVEGFLNFTFAFVVAVAESIEQQQHRGPGDGYGTVGNMDMLGADEAGDDQSKNKQRFSQ